MSVDISEKMKMVFFQKWQHRYFRMTAYETAMERVLKEKGEFYPDLVSQYEETIANEMSARLTSCIELLGKFNVELFKLDRFDSISMSHEGISDLHDALSDLKDSPNDYCPVLTVTIDVDSKNCIWLGTRGAYMLMNGLTKNDMSDIELDVNDIDAFVKDLAKKFCCAIEYETQEEADAASRDVFMFDGSKVLAEWTEFKWEGEGKDMQIIPKNPDFKKKSFEDVIKENFAKTVINIDVNQVS